MQLSDIIHLESIYIDSISQSKMAVLLRLSQIFSQNHSNLDEQELFDAYWKREALGSTAIGGGIIIPHIRSSVIKEPLGSVIRLLNPVDFGTEDKQPIDLVIGLLVPQEQISQHLDLLAAIIKQFSDPSFRDNCRQMVHAKQFYQLLCSCEEAVN